MLSVRRLMTGIGLVGPGVFLLAFCTVDNLLAAVLYVDSYELFFIVKICYESIALIMN